MYAPIKNLSYDLPKRGTLDITGTIYFVEVGLTTGYWWAMERTISVFFREQIAALAAIKIFSLHKACDKLQMQLLLCSGFEVSYIIHLNFICRSSHKDI